MRMGSGLEAPPRTWLLSLPKDDIPFRCSQPKGDQNQLQAKCQALLRG